MAKLPSDFCPETRSQRMRETKWAAAIGRQLSEARGGSDLKGEAKELEVAQEVGMHRQ